MKTLVQSINENISSLQDYIEKYMQSNYELAEKILKTENSYSALINGVDEYLKNPNTEDEVIKNNNGFRLAKLFDDSGISISNPTNYDIVERIILKHSKLIKTSSDSNELLYFIDYANNHKGEDKFKDSIEVNIKNNIFNRFYTSNDKKNSFINLAKYIFDILYFEKASNNSKSGSTDGRGELLLQLLFGTASNTNNTGDVHIGNLCVEVKCGNYTASSYAHLGVSRTMDNRDLSVKFIETIIENVKNVITDIDDKLINDLQGLLNNNTTLLGNKNELLNIRNIVDMLKRYTDDEDIIIKSYIQAILYRYGINNNSKIIEDILKHTPAEYKNIFSNQDVEIKMSNKNIIKHFAGILHIIGYRSQQSFHYLIVFTNNEQSLGDYIMIDCTSIENIFSQCDNNRFIFAKPRKEDRANTMLICLNESKKENNI